MTSFESGYNFFRSSAAAFSGADSAGVFVESVDTEIGKLIRDLNSMEGFKTATDKLKGDAFEFGTLVHLTLIQLYMKAPSV